MKDETSRLSFAIWNVDQQCVAARVFPPAAYLFLAISVEIQYRCKELMTKAALDATTNSPEQSDTQVP
jgi:hypothetical protein